MWQIHKEYDVPPMLPPMKHLFCGKFEGISIYLQCYLQWHNILYVANTHEIQCTSNVTSNEILVCGKFTGISIHLQYYLQWYYIYMWKIHKDFDLPPIFPLISMVNFWTFQFTSIVTSNDIKFSMWQIHKEYNVPPMLPPMKHLFVVNLKVFQFTSNVTSNDITFCM